MIDRSDALRPKTGLALFLENLFCEFEKGGISYCVLRNYETLPEYTRNDIDMWVSNQGLAELCLKRAAQNIDYEFIMVTALGVKNYWLAPREGRFADAIQIDMFSAIRWRNCTLVPSEVISTARRKYNGIHIPDFPIEGPCLLLAGLLSTTKVKERYRKALRQFATNYPDKFCELVSIPFGNKLGRQVTEFVKAGEWNRIELLVPQLRRAAAINAFKLGPAEQIRLWSVYAWQLLIKILFPPGMIVAVTGIDGSGKSSLVEWLVKELQPVFPLVHQFHWFAGGLPTASRLVGRTATGNGKAIYRRHPLFNVTRALYYLLDYHIAALIRFRWIQAFCGIVISDRSPYDFLVPLLINDGGDRRIGLKFAHRVLSTLAPRPDLVILIDASPEVALERKNEDPLDYLHAQRNSLYSVLKDVLPNNRLFVIDGDQEREEIHAEAEHAILTRTSSATSRCIQIMTLSPRLLNLLSGDAFHRERISGRSEISNNVVRSASALRKIRRELRDSGYTSTTHILFPSLKNARWVFPFDDRNLLCHAFSVYTPSTRYGRWRWNVLAKLCALGLFPFPNSDFLVLSNAQAENKGAAANWAEFAHEYIATLQPDELVYPALHLGAPRRPFPIYSGVLIGANSGPCAAFKAAGSQETNDSVRRECDVLGFLNGLDLTCGQIPKLLFSGKRQDNLELFLTDLGPTRWAARDFTFSDAHGQFLSELAEKTRRRISWAESEARARLMSDAQYLGNKLDPYIAKNIATLSAQIDIRWSDKIIPFNLAHGDFLPWNCRVTSDGVYAFDWEYAMHEATPFWDAFNFFFHTGTKDAARLIDTILKNHVLIKSVRADSLTVTYEFVWTTAGIYGIH